MASCRSQLAKWLYTVAGNVPDAELVRAASGVLAENVSAGQYRGVLDRLPEPVRAVVAAPARHGATD